MALKTLKTQLAAILITCSILGNFRYEKTRVAQPFNFMARNQVGHFQIYLAKTPLFHLPCAG